MSHQDNWLSLDAALNRLLQQAQAVTETQIVSLDQALGRVIAKPVLAQCDVPPWDNAMMDGYAINTLDSPTDGAQFTVQSEIKAGQAQPDTLRAGMAIRIMTGAPLPANANAVVMQEDVVRNGDQIEIHGNVCAGDNIRRRGLDVSKGDRLIERGTHLNASHLMLIASQGIAQVEVYRPVTIAIMATGDELCEAGKALMAGQIYESNRKGINGLIASPCVTIFDYGIIKDTKEALRNVFADAAAKADVIITSGGVSVGDSDFVKPVIEELGRIDFWKIAIKPGKPFALGHIQNSMVCGVPGNPVSAYVTTQLLILPLISRLSGEAAPLTPLRLRATLSCPIKRRAGRLEFMRANYQVNEHGECIVTPLSKQNSAVMTTVASANCYLLIDESTSELEQGAPVTILPFDQRALGRL